MIKCANTTTFWICPLCGYDHQPGEPMDEFYCLGCGPMGGEANKCNPVRRCDECNEEEPDCTCSCDCQKCDTCGECSTCEPDFGCPDCNPRKSWD